MRNFKWESSYAVGASAGGLVSIFGQNLVQGAAGVTSAASLPLPYALGGTSVTIGGRAAPLLAVAKVNGVQQINLQVPPELAGQSQLPVVVSSAGFRSDPAKVDVLAAQPGVFVGAGGQPIVLHADYSFVSVASPASPGEVVVIYCTGLGVTDPWVDAGVAAPTALTAVQPLVEIGGVSAPVLFSGLAPGFVGLYQVNVQIPDSAQAGMANLVLSVNGSASVPVQVALR